MADIDWQDAVDRVTPYVVKITTPATMGTGFLFSYSTDLCGIATAAHVVAHAHWWEQPIRREHVPSQKTIMLHRDERAVVPDEQLDSAAIVIPRTLLQFPSDLLPLIPEGNFLRVGNEVGWLGFPAISPANLCFFRGDTSCYVGSESAYLVDGVAINGVSGGPAFFLAGEHPMIIGVVSAYIANRVTGEALPGLCVIRDLKHLQGVVKKLRSIDEAKEREKQAKQPEPPPQPQSPAPGG